MCVLSDEKKGQDKRTVVKVAAKAKREAQRQCPKWQAQNWFSGVNTLIRAAEQEPSQANKASDPQTDAQGQVSFGMPPPMAQTYKSAFDKHTSRELQYPSSPMTAKPRSSGLTLLHCLKGPIKKSIGLSVCGSILR